MGLIGQIGHIGHIRQMVGVAGAAVLLAVVCSCAVADVQVDPNGAVTSIGRTSSQNLLAAPVNMRIVERAFVKQEEQKTVPVSGTKIIVENQQTVLDGIKLPPANRSVQRVIDDTSVAGKTIPGGYTKTVREAQLSWTLTRQDFGSGGKLAFKFNNLSNRLRSLDVEFPISLKDNDYRFFAPAQNDFPEWPVGSSVAYGIRDAYVYNQLSQPMCTLFSEGRDVGVTIASNYNFPVQPMSIYAVKSQAGAAVLVTFLRVRLDPRGSRTITLYLRPHQGDWRCGLDFARSTYPEKFYVREDAWKNLTPSFGGSAGTGSYYPGCFEEEAFWKNYMWKYNPRHGATMEMMALERWFGNWMSEKPEWTASLSEKWFKVHQVPEWYPKGFLDGKPAKDAPYKEIVKWLESRPESMFQEIFRNGQKQGKTIQTYDWYKASYDKVRKFIKTSKEHGAPMFLYWNPRDVWYPYAKEEFPDQILYHAEEYFDTDAALCNPVKGSKYYNQQVAQIERMFKIYPELDGIFNDQCYGGGAISNYDDTYTVRDDGTVAADLSGSLAQMTKAASDICHKYGKLLWSNHCTEVIDIVGNADLACSEDREAAGMGQEPARYSVIGNRPYVNLQQGELVMQASLRNGAHAQTGHIAGLESFDYTTRLQQDNAWAARLYQPMFDLISDKEWVLEPHCLTLPTGFDGNLYRVGKERNVFATVIASGEYCSTPWTRLDVPVTVRVKDASEVKAAYLIGAANLGAYKIPFERSGNRISVSIPRFKGAASVLFAKTGRFVSVETASPIGTAGGTWGYNVVADNFTNEHWSWKGVTWVNKVPQWNWEEIPAGKSVSAFFKIDLPADYTQPFTNVMLAKEVPSIIPAEEGAEHHYAYFEFFVDKPLVASISPSREMVRQTVSNSGQGGYKPLWHPFPLHIVTGQTQELTVGVINNNSTVEEFYLDFTATGVTIENLPGSYTVGPNSRTNFLLKIKGTTRGPGSVKIVMKDKTGTVAATDELKFDVYGNTLSEADLAQVKSATLVYDIWGSTPTEGADTKKISLNGVEVGKLEGSGGYSLWITKVKAQLTDAAKSALKTSNTISISNPSAPFWKIRNVALDVQLNDGSMVRLSSDGSAASSPAAQPWAEGKMLNVGEVAKVALR